MALFLVVAFIGQSAHNAEVYATDRAKLLHLLIFTVYLSSTLWRAMAKGTCPLPSCLSSLLVVPSLIQSLLMVGYEGVFWIPTRQS